ncbi:MAG: ATP-binding protein [Mycobacteriales bacterium]
MVTYLSRLIDQELAELLPSLAAIALEGPKGVGKTATGVRHAATCIALDDPAQRELLAANPQRLETDQTPIFLDEWQRYPEVWDLVRRSVDDNPAGGRFLLAGSATPLNPPTHSGAGRIVRLRMRPLSLAERLPGHATVSLSALLNPTRATIGGDAEYTLADYTHDVLSSGFPAIASLPERARRLQLDGYLDRLAEHDFPEQGHPVRRPAALRSWLAAYAAATSTTASYNAILDAATPGESDKPSKVTTTAYRDILTQLWLIDDVPAWTPPGSEFTRLGQAPKHHLADPALAARLLNVTDTMLLRGVAPDADAFSATSLLGRLFESLVTMGVKVYAQSCDAAVYHLRDRGGEHEVDLVVQAPDGQILALEIKLTRSVTDADTRHLHWLARSLGDKLADAAVITTGPYAYRRTDGIAVIPAVLLGS